ncbi:MAG: 4-(cytidine 5'-diphospho)-2-C-methyl-D-erythritol kinase [Oscillospiraceae bacterium]
MKYERERAWAKLNLTLDVLSPMPDGYHGMRMVMQSCTLCDEVRVMLTSDGSFFAHSNLYYLPCDDRNIAIKAARAFFEEIGETRSGVRIDMKKCIPVCAGLGGGSSDAAAVLRALNRLTGVNMNRKKLEALGLRLGADVPFCISGGTYLAEGRGEILTKLPDMPSCGIVICKPRFSISTPELFSRIDLRAEDSHPDTERFIQALHQGNLSALASQMRNVFEDVLAQNQEEIFSIKRRLLDHGALSSMMTGTGSAVFGLFTTRQAAQKAARELGREYRECFFAEPKCEIPV